MEHHALFFVCTSLALILAVIKCRSLTAEAPSFVGSTLFPHDVENIKILIG
jgi:hypothetical protein